MSKMDPTDFNTSRTDNFELSEREQRLVAREVDLQSRRREAASQLRRSRRDFSKVETRLASIEMHMLHLAQAVLQAGFKGSESISAPEPSSCNSTVEEELRSEVKAMRAEMDSLSSQNEELANELAQASMRRSIGNSSDANPTMSWEQRKALIFAQDAEGSVVIDTQDTSKLRAAVERLRSDLQDRDTELSQLRELLERQPTRCEEGTTIGAAAIANLMDSDELIREERERLQSLQTEWESKFRHMEISASIERANLARERQQLERQNVELEEQLAHLKRELRQEEITGPNQPRRWFAKLGLGD